MEPLNKKHLVTNRKKRAVCSIDFCIEQFFSVYSVHLMENSKFVKHVS